MTKPVTPREQREKFWSEFTNSQKNKVCRAYKNLKAGEQVLVYDPREDVEVGGTVVIGQERSNRGSISRVVRIRKDGEKMAYSLHPACVVKK